MFFGETPYEDLSKRYPGVKKKKDIPSMS